MRLDPPSKYGSGSKTAKSVRIFAGPDPQHCFEVCTVHSVHWCTGAKGRIRQLKRLIDGNSGPTSQIGRFIYFLEEIYLNISNCADLHLIK